MSHVLSLKAGAAQRGLLLSRELPLCLAGPWILAWRNCGNIMLQMVWASVGTVFSHRQRTRMSIFNVGLEQISTKLCQIVRLYCIWRIISFLFASHSFSLYCSHVHPSVRLLSVCHRGYFNCSYSPCPAVCTVYSDRHYHTFDGLEYDYHSDCQVYLLKVSRLCVWEDFCRYFRLCT